MQSLFKNLFNSMNLFEILLTLSIKIFLGSFVKGTLRYQKINFFTTSALFTALFGYVEGNIVHFLG